MLWTDLLLRLSRQNQFHCFLLRPDRLIYSKLQDYRTLNQSVKAVDKLDNASVMLPAFHVRTLLGVVTVQ